MAAALTDVQTIFSTYSAFAALKADGSVVTWGDGDYGGTSAVAADLIDVQTIFGLPGFCRVERDGTVVAWGSSYYGGDSSEMAQT